MKEDYYSTEFSDLIKAMDNLANKTFETEKFDIEIAHTTSHNICVSKKWDGTPTIYKLEIRFDDSSMKFNFHGKAEFKMFGYGFVITDDRANIEEYNTFLDKAKRFTEVTINDYPKYAASFSDMITDLFNIIDYLKLGV